MSTRTAALETTAIRIPIGGHTWLTADIAAPPNATGVVLFAHGSGSSRFSPRNRYVASKLNSLQMATVLADLLTEEEERRDKRTGELRFDIPLLTQRLVKVIDWIETWDVIAALPIGLFGASTGAAAALDAAAERPALVHAVVSHGGRPDLASRLRAVRAPTFVIAGSDTDEAVASAAGAWFQRFLGRAGMNALAEARTLQPRPAAHELVIETLAGFHLQPDFPIVKGVSS